MSDTTTSKRPWGYLVEFDSAPDLYHAAEKVRDAGFKKWDVHTPYPIHGMDHAMGLGKSWLSAIVLGGGITGLLTALALQFLTQVGLYPTIVQNKPASPWTMPAFFPVTFELTILLSGFATLFGLLILILLPRWNHPLLASELFKKFSDDGFLLVIEARDAKFRTDKTRDFLESIGGQNLELIEEEA